jgi:hypothetical protein
MHRNDTILATCDCRKGIACFTLDQKQSLECDKMCPFFGLDAEVERKHGQASFNAHDNSTNFKGGDNNKEDDTTRSISDLLLATIISTTWARPFGWFSCSQQ